jgi:hypothetical protein
MLVKCLDNSFHLDSAIDKFTQLTKYSIYPVFNATYYCYIIIDDFGFVSRLGYSRSRFEKYG